MIRRTITAAGVASALTTVALLGPAIARADQGGDGDPRSCSDAYVVASNPLTGERGPTRDKTIGYLELRWSGQCHANWARVILFGGMYSSPVTLEQEITVEGRTAKSGDYQIKTGKDGTSAWTPYVRLANSGSTACVAASASSDFDTLNFHTVGARFCV